LSDSTIVGNYLSVNALGAFVNITNTTAADSTLSDFILVENAYNLSMNAITLKNITNTNLIDATKALIATSSITGSVVLVAVHVRNSILLNSPALLIDTVPSLYLYNSTFKNVTISNSNMLIIKKIPVLLVQNSSFNLILSSSGGN
jgi:hypothetical protein